MNISVEDKKEIIKASAFGYSADKIAEVTGVSKEDVDTILAESENEIAEVKERYNEQ